MKLKSATFEFDDKDLGCVLVDFEGDFVSVVCAKVDGTNVRTHAPIKIPNKPAKWGGRPFKPRVADSLRAVAKAMLQK